MRNLKRYQVTDECGTHYPYFGKKLDFLFMRRPVCFATGSHGLYSQNIKIHIY